MSHRWLCTEKCYNRIFGHEDPNAMRVYEAGEEYEFPESATDMVPTQYFDRIEAYGALVADLPEVEEPQLKRATPPADIESMPVETLCQFTEKRLAGLHAEGILTIGDLRTALSTKAGEDRLLDSPNVNIGPASIVKYKKLLDANYKEEGDDK